MSIEAIKQQTTNTHRYHTHSNHRSSTLLVEQLVQTSPQITTCYSGSTTNNAAALASATALPQDATYECKETTEAREASHDLLDYYLNDSISDAPSASDTAFGQLDIKLDTLDFSLTRRLLGAVFFLLIIYAWKQYIDDEEESDTIYI